MTSALASGPLAPMSDVIELASTGRAKCRHCQQKIDKGELRFGEKVPNAFGEGESTSWFHVACAAEKRPEKLLAALDAHDGEVRDRDRLREIAQAGAANPKLAMIIRAERAPSGRAACQHCREKIEKDALRIAFEKPGEPMGGAMPQTGYVHLACAKSHFGADGLLEKLERVTPELGADDRETLRRELS